MLEVYLCSNAFFWSCDLDMALGCRVNGERLNSQISTPAAVKICFTSWESRWRGKKKQIFGLTIKPPKSFVVTVWRAQPVIGFSLVFLPLLETHEFSIARVGASHPLLYPGSRMVIRTQNFALATILLSLLLSTRGLKISGSALVKKTCHWSRKNNGWSYVSHPDLY
jgi:hypothetical protein